MPVEHSAGAIVFRKESGEMFYLILHYEEGHWGYPKGHIEKKETLEETARREIREETGITDVEFISGFKELTKYFFVFEGQRIFKTVVFLLAKTHNKEIQLSFEHIGYAWLPYLEALERITFKDEKTLLEKAEKLIKQEGYK
jgi:8-oxo-dGTP pyrophosphatase MutT (NUDIX family)